MARGAYTVGAAVIDREKFVYCVWLNVAPAVVVWQVVHVVGKNVGWAECPGLVMLL